MAAALSSAVAQCASVISPLNLNATVKLLRELGFDDRADEALEIYIRSRRDRPEIFDLDHAGRMGDIDDPKTRARFAEEFVAARPSMTLEQAADMIIRNTDWHDGIPVAFGSATVEQLVVLLLSHQGPYLRHLVSGVFRMPVPEDEREGIRLKMVAALRVVGRRSVIDRMRVERLGVSMDV
ncbi:hypothetical protein [Paraburkholderia sp. GAS199]|uniref:hypothetical protein n=1 Tax=Paraburkholderia sp. GAS199 TaxID=3035126 RepID=UPI003D257618